MKLNFIIAGLLLISLSVFGQLPGDTLVVSTFNYGSTTRDTMINFSAVPSVPIAKVLMLYNMRCKNGLISPGTAGQTNIGCGEWDYSCNTYLTDSSKVDSLLSTKPSHVISNFSGTSYPYVTSPYYHLFQYPQVMTTAVVLSENQFQVGSGTNTINSIASGQNSGRFQYLFTQAELAAAGVVAGHIDGILLNALNSANVNFLKVQMKHSSQTVLSAASPDTSALFTMYNMNTNFTIGSNRLQFQAPFNWDGVSNILIDVSFTNSSAGNALSLVGTTTPSIYSLKAMNGYYINTASGITSTLSAAPFSSIGNEITVSFWSRGNTGVNARATSIIEGVDNNNRRQLNIHHPWSNSRVYFDCGNNGSGYDRIDKLATLAEIENNWNHWAFTKNVVTGIMNIYLNGSLWHTGSGKTMPINIDSMALGANINAGNNFYGDIDELCVWNAELSQSTILSWMNKQLDGSHPNTSNLVAYYKLDEGSGAISTDASSFSGQANFGSNADWNFTRGHQLSRFFTESNQRPNMTFLQGNYTISNTAITVFDSLQAAPNLVKEYTVIPNPGSLLNDTYSLVSTNSYWVASYRFLYDGVTGAKIDSFIITPTSTLNITNLPFMNRYPSKFEIMSFVTPYGINLDLGMNGKTWTFDVTDFLPILKGNKRLSIERGGEWQENLDIKFLFVVGTPVREVKDIIQIWRQPVNCNYNQINTDVYFEPRNVPLRADGKSFKIRNMITGHGQEGEFIPRTHIMNINAGSEEFNWTVYKKCASNPVYPQGGTWIYDRCGWCPGMATDLKEMDITPYVTPGSSANIDYHMPAIPVTDPPIGTSNYIVTNQMVTYGALNFNLDAAIVDIMAPTNKIEYAREHSMCAQPKIKFQNTGSTTLSSLSFEYWLNNNPIKTSFTWNGTLAPLETMDIELPNYNLWNGVNSPSNDFHIEIKNPNGGVDEYVHNNKMNSSFVVTDVVPSNFIIHHRSNSFPSETKYELFNEWGTSIFSRSGMTTPNATYKDTFNLTYGCYKFVVTDTDEDGISFWANSDGAGLMRFLRGNGTTLKTFNPDFGASIVYNFTVDYPLKYEDIYPENEIKIYPNPAGSQFFIEALGIDQASVTMYNAVGELIKAPITKSSGKVSLNSSNLARGIYFIQVMLDGKTSTHKLVLE